MTQLSDHYDDVGPGWKRLLEQLHADISVLKSDYQVSQVKEKFGALRVYLDRSTRAMDDLIREAEKKSAHLCEVCGQPGELGGNYYLRTLCAEHRKADDEARENRWKEYER